MDLNRETAMRLWGKSFGKVTKVKDFAGREIVKGAYNDRNSDYCWNVDHVLPQSQGGKTADYNLVCCHMLTNDEKADKFPCFTANDIRFEIVKVENHYEIRRADKTSPPIAEHDDSVNFYDSAAGIRFFKDLKGIQNKPVHTSSVLIRIQNLSSTAVVEFIENIFDSEHISFSRVSTWNGEEIRILIHNYYAPNKFDSEEMLNKCVLLNTFFTHYFCPLEYVKGYDIYYRDDDFDSKKTMCEKSELMDFRSINGRITNTVHLNDAAIANTSAAEKITINPRSEYSEYNFVFTTLSKNLDKEVNKG